MTLCEFCEIRRICDSLDPIAHLRANRRRSHDNSYGTNVTLVKHFLKVRFASVAFGRLRINVWERNGIRLDTKLKVYKAVVLPTLLYACETWTVYQRHAKKLNHFHLSCLRKLLKIRWQDEIPDTEVLKKANMQSVHTLLKLA